MPKQQQFLQLGCICCNPSVFALSATNIIHASTPHLLICLDACCVNRPAYLHLVLTANKGARLPAPALWLLRHAKFRTLADGDYGQLLDDFDRSMIPWLLEFQVRRCARE